MLIILEILSFFRCILLTPRNNNSAELVVVCQYCDIAILKKTYKNKYKVVCRLDFAVKFHVKPYSIKSHINNHLFFSPSFHSRQSRSDFHSPNSGAQPLLWLAHHLVEDPHIDKVKQLREQLYRERCVHTTSS